MTLFLDKDRLEASLKHVTGPAVLAIDPLSVDPIELTHALRQIRGGRLDEKVIMVGHQAICMTDPTAALNDLPGNSQEFLAIMIRK